MWDDWGIGVIVHDDKRNVRCSATWGSPIALLCLLALGCNAVFGTDDLRFDRPAAPPTTTTSSATTSTTASGGGGAGPASDCDDGRVGPDETDVDCGGACPPCPNGAGCERAEDCTSLLCRAGTCAPCESPLDCGPGRDCVLPEGNCRGRLPNGESCNTPLDCASGFCPIDDSVCCDTPCVLRCEACLASKTGAADGICDFVDPEIAADPDGECVTEDVSTCGSDGSGCLGDRTACGLWPDGTVCEPPSCSSGTARSARSCDGEGTCKATTETDCSPYVCDATSCRSSCSLHSHCDATHYCAANTCTPRLGSGASCTFPEQCLSNDCTSGVCG